MVRYVLEPFGWLLVVTTIFNILIKLFASDAIVLGLAGSSRSINEPSMGLAFGLIFLGISAVLRKLEALQQRIDEREDK